MMGMMGAGCLGVLSEPGLKGLEGFLGFGVGGA